MSAKGPSWKTVALALADRLSYASPCATHPNSDGDCPFCRDAAAYAMFVERLAADGERIHDPFAGVPSINIADIRVEDSKK